MIGKMFLRWRFDVCPLSDTKLKGKGEVMFGEVVSRVSGVAGGRTREGCGPVTEWVVDEVCKSNGRRCHPGLCGLE